MPESVFRSDAPSVFSRTKRHQVALASSADPIGMFTVFTPFADRMIYPPLFPWSSDSMCPSPCMTIHHFHEKAQSSQEPKPAVADYFLSVFGFIAQGSS